MIEIDVAFTFRVNVSPKGNELPLVARPKILCTRFLN